MKRGVVIRWCWLSFAVAAALELHRGNGAVGSNVHHLLAAQSVDGEDGISFGTERETVTAAGNNLSGDRKLSCLAITGCKTLNADCSCARCSSTYTYISSTKCCKTLSNCSVYDPNTCLCTGCSSSLYKVNTKGNCVCVAVTGSVLDSTCAVTGCSSTYTYLSDAKKCCKSATNCSTYDPSTCACTACNALSSLSTSGKCVCNSVTGSYLDTTCAVTGCSSTYTYLSDVKKCCKNVTNCSTYDSSTCACTACNSPYLFKSGKCSATPTPTSSPTSAPTTSAPTDLVCPFLCVHLATTRKLQDLLSILDPSSPAALVDSSAMPAVPSASHHRRLCFAGTWKSGLNCNSCDAGFYCPGDDVKYPCSAGSYSGLGALQCTSCSAGSYSSSDHSTCIQCTAGTSSGVVPSNTCAACNQGTYSGVGASSCTACSAGTTSASGASSCTICPPGTWSAAQQSSCTTCPASTYSLMGSTSVSACTASQYKCTSGYITSISLRSSDRLDQLTSFTCSEGASPVMVNIGSSFNGVPTTGIVGPFSAYSSGFWDSVGASAGVSFTSTSSPSAFIYGSSSNSVTTKSCPSGQLLSGFDVRGVNSNTVALLGSYAICTSTPAPTPAPTPSCTPGYYYDAVTNACTQCAMGYYSSTTGAASCTLCAAGKFAGTTGATSCTKCAAGKYSSTTGATVCTDCAVNTFSANSGATSCAACAPGTASVAGSTSCSANCLCSHGTAVDVSSCPSAGSNVCATCDSGYYKTSSSACVACSNGGASNNYSCPYGSYTNGDYCFGDGTIDSQTCQVCSNGGSNYKCSIGYFMGFPCDGNSGVDSQTCIECHYGAAYVCPYGFKRNGTQCPGNAAHDTQTCTATPTPAPTTAKPTKTANPTLAPTATDAPTSQPTATDPPTTATPTASPTAACPCVNGGTCASASDTTCNCLLGFYGSDCESTLDLSGTLNINSVTETNCMIAEGFWDLNKVATIAGRRLQSVNQFSSGDEMTLNDFLVYDTWKSKCSASDDWCEQKWVDGKYCSSDFTSWSIGFGHILRRHVNGRTNGISGENFSDSNRVEFNFSAPQVWEFLCDTLKYYGSLDVSPDPKTPSSSLKFKFIDVSGSVATGRFALGYQAASDVSKREIRTFFPVSAVNSASSSYVCSSGTPT